MSETLYTWLRPKDGLHDHDVERGLAMLLRDGVFAQVMTVLTVGAFLIAFALELGASNRIVGVLAAIGPLAQVLQVPSIVLVEGLRLRKMLSVLCFGGARLALLGAAAVPWIAPAPWSLVLFLIFLGLHYGLSAVGSCAFNSWIRDLIPEPRVESFFAGRLTYATAVGALLSLAAGFCVDGYRDHVGNALGAYSILFALGCGAGLVSLSYIARMPEQVMPHKAHGTLRSILSKPCGDRGFRNLLSFLGAWNFAYNFTFPFFTVYLLQRLNLNMAWVLGLTVLSQLVNALFFGIWGRLANRFSNKSVLLMSVPWYFATFLIWPFTTLPNPHMFTIPLLILIHVLMGMSYSGVVLCANNLALKSAPYGQGASYMAVIALVSGIAATAGPILAGFAADWFAPMALPALRLEGLDFLFLMGFMFGLYSIHRLLAIREEGEAGEGEFRRAFLAETGLMIRRVSAAAGVRQCVAFVLGLGMGIRN